MVYNGCANALMVKISQCFFGMYVYCGIVDKYNAHSEYKAEIGRFMFHIALP